MGSCFFKICFPKIERYRGDEYLKASENQPSAPNDLDRFLDLIREFCSNPAHYSWRLLGIQKLLVPFSFLAKNSPTIHETRDLKLPPFEGIRWENHLIYIMEGVAFFGEKEMLARKRFYIDKETNRVLLGEDYDGKGDVVSYYIFSDSRDTTSGRSGHWYSLRGV